MTYAEVADQLGAESAEHKEALANLTSSYDGRLAEKQSKLDTTWTARRRRATPVAYVLGRGLEPGRSPRLALCWE